MIVGTKTNFYEKKRGKESELPAKNENKVGRRKLRCLAVGMKTKINNQKNEGREWYCSPWEISDEYP